MTGWASYLPDAMDQLVLLAKHGPELQDAGVAVRDGCDLSDNSATSVLYIGWTGGTTDVDADGQVNAEGMGGDPDREQTVVRCCATVLLGNSTISAGRRAAFALMSGLGAVLSRHRNLNGTVMRAQLGSYQLTQQQTSKGTAIALVFEVDLDGYTRRQ